MFELIEYQLVQLVDILGESLVQGKFLVILLVLLSKRERFMHIYCQIYKTEMADLKGIFENQGGCQLWFPMYGNQGWLPTTPKEEIVVPSEVCVVVVGTNIVAFESWHQ